MFFCLVIGVINDSISFTEEKRNAPQSSNADKGVDNSADDRCLSSKDPRNNVKSEKS